MSTKQASPLKGHACNFNAVHLSALHCVLLCNLSRLIGATACLCARHVFGANSEDDAKACCMSPTRKDLHGLCQEICSLFRLSATLRKRQSM